MSEKLYIVSLNIDKHFVHKKAGRFPYVPMVKGHITILGGLVLHLELSKHAAGTSTGAHIIKVFYLKYSNI